MTRRYRKKSSASSIISDTAYIGSKLPWWGALLFGLITFVAFYWIIPGWLETKLQANSGNPMFPAIEAIYGRRLHWFQWVGIACGLVGLFFTIRNYFVSIQAGHPERGIVGFLAKIFGRGIN